MSARQLRRKSRVASSDIVAAAGLAAAPVHLRQAHALRGPVGRNGRNGIQRAQCGRIALVRRHLGVLLRPLHICARARMLVSAPGCSTVRLQCNSQTAFGFFWPIPRLRMRRMLTIARGDESHGTANARAISELA